MLRVSSSCVLGTRNWLVNMARGQTNTRACKRWIFDKKELSMRSGRSTIAKSLSSHAILFQQVSHQFRANPPWYL